MYSIDTSAILHAWLRAYPPANFPAFWSKIDGLINASDLIAIEEVLIELERKDDDVYRWAKSHSRMIVAIDEPVQLAVQEVLGAHPRLIDTRKSRSGADPFVIALAKVKGATVLTQESRSNNTSRPHIPDVCSALSIPCVDLLELIRQQRWVF